jgi:HK97 family phage major capsid protein
MANEVAKRLRDRRLNVWEQAKEIADKAAEENRAFSAEEQGTWDALNEELDKLDVRIKAVLEQEQRSKDADEQFNRIHGQPAEKGKGAPSTVPGDAELRAFLRGDPGAPKYFDVKPTPGVPVSYRTLVTNVTAAGGNTVPTSFYDQLVQHMIETSGILQTNPTVLNTTSGEPLQIPKTTTHPVGVLTAQTGTLPTADPAFGMTTLGAFKYAWFGQVSRELVDDTGVDLQGYLSQSAGRGIGNAFGADLITGTGASKPAGLLTSASNSVTGTTTGVNGIPTYDNLVDLQYSVISPYRSSRSCFWLMRDAVVGALRKIKDTTGQPIWQPSMQLGAPDLLLGKPLASDPFMPAIITGARMVAFGDFSTFFVRQAGGVRFERSDDFAFGTDLVSYRAILRGDGALVDLTGSIKTYVGALT